MIWRELETVATDIVRLGKARLDSTGVVLLGTLRRDGSPRISPVEPYLVQGNLIFGVMAWSAKAKDLMRDPRCVLHSAVSDPENPEGELKLYGRAARVEDPEIRESRRDAWWVGRPQGAALVFSLSIEEAAFFSWNAESGVVTIRRWSAERGLTTVERSYP